MREDVIAAHAECGVGLRAHPPAAAVGIEPHPQGDAAHLQPRALPRPRRPDPRARPRRRDHHRHHRRLPGRDRGGLRSRRWRSPRRSATTAPSPSSSARGGAPPPPRWTAWFPHPVKVERMERLVEVVQRRARERAQRFVGRTLEVLVEGPSRTDPSSPARVAAGTTRRSTSTAPPRPASCVEVEIEAATSTTLSGQEKLLSRVADSERGRADRRAGRDLRPDRGRQDGRRGRPCASGCARRGEDPVAISCDAIAGLPRAGDDQRRALGGRARGSSSTGSSGSAALDRGVQRRPLRRARGGRDRRSCSASGRRPIVVGGTGLYMRAALTEIELRPPVDAAVRAAVESEIAERGSAALHAELAADVAARVHPNDRKRIARALELQRSGLDPPERSEQLWTRGAAPADPARRPGLRPRAARRRIERRVEAMAAAGAGEEARAAAAAGASRTARAALGFEDVRARATSRRSRRAHRRYARRQMTWLRKTPGDRADRPRAGWRRRRERAAQRILGAAREYCAAMRFEKWQALGNDYIVLERDEIDFELTPKRDPGDLRRALRLPLRRHPAALPQRRRPLRRRAADLQPRRLGGRALGQRRPRGGALPAPRGLDRRGHLLDPHRGRRDHADPDRAGLGVDRDGPGLDRARRTIPTGPADGRGAIDVGGVEREFQHVSIGNPQCAIEVADGLEELDLPRDRAADRGRRRSSRTAPTSASGGVEGGRSDVVRARIFERGVGETLSSGTGASGAAVAAFLRGAPSPITVRLDGGELEVEISDDLEVRLTGDGEPGLLRRVLTRVRRRAGAKLTTSARWGREPVCRWC